jgi:imidazolonepropionase-like amidohydrolase
MRRTLPSLAATVSTAVLLSCGSGATDGPADRTPADGLALVGGTIYVDPVGEPIRAGVALVRDGMLAAVGSRASVALPKDVRVLDCTGSAIVAGFWNSHVHFFERKWANAEEIPAHELGRQIEDTFTRHGFTTVFDLGSPWQNTRRIRERVESREVAGPRIRSTGYGLTPPGVVPPDQVLDVLGVMRNPNPAPVVADAAQAAAAARRQLDGGVDGIKLHSLAEEDVIHAAVTEAHRDGMPVFAHPSAAGSGLTGVVRGGVDIVAHTTPWTGPWDDTILAAMKERRVALVPTLRVWKHLRRHDRLSAQEEWVRTAVGQLRAWVAAGGTVLFGTDSGAVDADPREEYVLMAEAGMTFRDILASLTTAPARRFGEADSRGRVAAGFRADLVVLMDDPSRDVRAFAAVRYALRDGRIIHRATE